MSKLSGRTARHRSRFLLAQPCLKILGVLAGSFLGLAGCEKTRAPIEFELVFGTEKAHTVLDPRFATDTHSENAAELLFDGLLRLDQSLQLAPSLAELPKSQDGKVYDYQIRGDAFFHGGKKVRTEDVIYTYEFLKNPKNASPYQGTFDIIDRIEKRDSQTIRFTLKKPYAFFPIATMRPVVASASEKNPIGSGPFQLVENMDRRGLLLEANPMYFKKAPNVRKLRIKPVMDMNVRLLELMKGSIQIVQNSAEGFPPGALERLKREPNIDVQSGPSTIIQYLNFNMKHPHLKKLQVRQAIAHAIDRKKIIQYKLGGYAQEANTFLPKIHWLHSSKTKTYEFDPKKAKALLKEIGFGPGEKELQITYSVSTNPQSIEIAQTIANQLKEVGIEVKLVSKDIGIFFDEIKSGKFDMYSLQWTGIVNPDHYYDVFHSRNVPPLGLNRNFYANAELDKLLERARTTLDRNQLKTQFQQIQDIVAQDIPALPLWYPDHIAAYRKNVKGYELHPRGTYDSLIDVIFHP